MNRNGVAGFSLFDNFSRVSEVTLENRLRPINTNIFKEVPRAPMQNFRSVEGFSSQGSLQSPTDVTATLAEDGAIILNWIYPREMTSNSQIPNYSITAFDGCFKKIISHSQSDQFVSNTGGGNFYQLGGRRPSKKITGLRPGTSYTFTIIASEPSRGGSSTFSPSAPSAQSNPVTTRGTAPPPVTIPAAPTEVRAFPNLDEYDGSIIIKWIAPDVCENSPITNYTITASPGGITKTLNKGDTYGNVRDLQFRTRGRDTETKFSGLPYGTSYRFTIAATNSFGTGPMSSPSAPLLLNQQGIPEKIENLIVIEDLDQDGTVHLEWKAPRSIPGFIISYKVTAALSEGGEDPNGITRTVTTNKTTFTGLTIGSTYQFTVTPTTSAASGPVSITGLKLGTGGIPPPPIISAMRDWEQDETIILKLRISEYRNEKARKKFPITKITITANPGGITKIVKARSDGTLPTTINFDGLTNGTSYTFTGTSTTSGATSVSYTSNHAFAVEAAYAGAKGNNKDPYSQKPMRAFNGSTDTTQDGAIDIRWIPPSGLRDTGERMIEYIITASDGQVKTVNAETVEEEVYQGMLHKKTKFTGLMPGTPYTFRIALKTSYGIHTATELNTPIMTRGTAPRDGNLWKASVIQSAPPAPAPAPVTVAEMIAAMKAAEEKPLAPPGTAPGVPTNVIAAPLSQAQRDPNRIIQEIEPIRISWTAPSSPSPIIAYIITPSAPLVSINMGGIITSETNQTILAANASIDGVSMTVVAGKVGTSYTFTVTAINASGKGLPSSPSAPIVTPGQTSNSSGGLPGMNTASSAASAEAAATAAREAAATAEREAAATAAREAAATAAREAAAREAAAREAAATAAREAAATAAREAAATEAREAAATEAREAAARVAREASARAAREAADAANLASQAAASAAALEARRKAEEQTAKENAAREAILIATREAEAASQAAAEARKKAEEQTAKEDAAREQAALATREAQILPQPTVIPARVDSESRQATEARQAREAREAREAAAIATRELQIASQAGVEARREAAEQASREEAAMKARREAQLALQAVVEARRQSAQQRGNSSSGLPGMDSRSQPSYQDYEKQKQQEAEQREDRQYRRQNRNQELQQQKQRDQQLEQRNLTTYCETCDVNTPVEDISGVKSPQQTSTKKELTLSEDLISYDNYVIITLLVTSLILGTIFIGVITSARQRI